MLREVSAETPQSRRLPLLLVDVDGVVSVWGWSHDESPDGVWTLVDGIGHFLASGPAQRLAALADAFELWWCSGWEEKADEHLPRLVGLGPLPHLSFETTDAATRPAREHWKLAAIDAEAGPDRAVAWVDDAFDAACHAWAAERPGPTLLVTTRPAEGFTATQAATLRSWAAELP